MQKMYRFLLTLLATEIICFSCASTPKSTPPTKTSDSQTVSEENTDNAERQPIAIPINVNTSRSYFSSVNKEALSLAQNGSPDALRQAVQILRRSPAEDYKENEKVLLLICSSIMELVWQSERTTWEVPNVSDNNPYTGAILSAKRGLYDSSTGNSDFFTLLLPSLVLTGNSTRTDYFDDSENSLKESISLNPDSVIANYLLGTLYLKEKKAEESVLYLEKSLKLSENVSEINFAYTSALHLAGQYQESLARAENLLLSSPQNVQLLELCAQNALSLEDYTKAENYVLRVLQIEPENLDYVLLRAKILVTKGDFIKASSLLDVYARSNPNGKDYLLLRASLQRDWNKNNTLSAETIGKALNLYPNDLEVLLFAAELASTSETQVGGSSAYEIAQKVLEEDPLNEKALEICVKELSRAEDYESAYALSSSLIRRGNANQSFLAEHTNICLMLGRNDEAWNLAQQLYSKSPKDETAQQTYIKVLVATGRRSQAQQFIEDNLPQSSSRMKSILYYQKSLLDTDDDSILSDLRSSLTANPRNQDSLYRLYRIYYNRKDWRRAQYYLKQVVALNPSDSILALNAELDTLIGR